MLLGTRIAKWKLRCHFDNEASSISRNSATATKEGKKTHPLFSFAYYCTLGYRVLGMVSKNQCNQANILTVISTAFGSVTYAIVIWLHILEPKIAIDFKLYSQGMSYIV